MATTASSSTVATINGRVDRLPTWCLPKAAFAILGIAYFIDIYDVSIVGYSLPALTSEFHLSGGEVTLMLTGNLAGTAVGAVIFGFLGDVLGRRRTFLLGLGTLAATALLTAFAWDLASFLTFRILSGLATGGGIAVVTALVQEFSPSQRRGKYLAYNVWWSGVAAVAAGFLSTALVPIPDVGWRILFGVGAIALVLMLFVREPVIPESPRWLAVKGDIAEADRITTAMEARAEKAGYSLGSVADVPDEETAPHFSLRSLLRPPYLQRLLVVCAFWFGVQWSVRATITFQPSILTKFGLSLETGTLLLAIGTLAGVAVYCVMPFIVDRVERRILIVTGLVLATLSPVLVTITSGAPGAVIAASVLTQVAGPILFVPGFAYASEIFPTTARSSAGSVATGSGYIGGIIQSVVLVSVVASANPHVSMLVVGAGYVFAALVIFFLAIPATGRPLTAISNDSTAFGAGQARCEERQQSDVDLPPDGSLVELSSLTHDAEKRRT